MSRASRGVTPILGIAVFESTAGGFSIQRIMLSGSFDNTPAMYTRLAI